MPLSWWSSNLPFWDLCLACSNICGSSTHCAPTSASAPVPPFRDLKDLFVHVGAQSPLIGLNFVALEEGDNLIFSHRLLPTPSPHFARHTGKNRDGEHTTAKRTMATHLRG